MASKYKGGTCTGVALRSYEESCVAGNCRMVGIKTLIIGYINDVELAKKVARATSVRRLSI